MLAVLAMLLLLPAAVVAIVDAVGVGFRLCWALSMLLLLEGWGSAANRNVHES